MSTLQVHLEDATDGRFSPPPASFQSWASAVESRLNRATSLCLRLVSEAEMTQLNETYRGRQGSTNVLAFSAEPATDIVLAAGMQSDEDFLGDLAICADVVEQERLAQEKNRDAHWAHLFIHGVLHLLGYDHANDTDAKKMETLETQLLRSLNFPAPYEAD